MYTVKAYYFNRNFKPIVKRRITYLGAKITAEWLYAHKDAVNAIEITDNSLHITERKGIV